MKNLFFSIALVFSFTNTEAQKILQIYNLSDYPIALSNVVARHENLEIFYPRITGNTYYSIPANGGLYEMYNINLFNPNRFPFVNQSLLVPKIEDWFVYDGTTETSPPVGDVFTTHGNTHVFYFIKFSVIGLDYGGGIVGDPAREGDDFDYYEDELVQGEFIKIGTLSLIIFSNK